MSTNILLISYLLRLHREREREIKIGISIQDVTQIKKTKDYCLVKFHDEIDF